MKKYFKIKIGYGKDDFISIDETQLEKALNAQITGKIAIFPEGSVSGNSIISITPDYHQALGFRHDAEINEKDYAHLEPEYKGSIELAKINLDRKENGLPKLEQYPADDNTFKDVIHIFQKSIRK